MVAWLQVKFPPAGVANIRVIRCGLDHNVVRLQRVFSPWCLFVQAKSAFD